MAFISGVNAGAPAKIRGRRPSPARCAFAAAPGAGADVLFMFTSGMDRFDYLRLLGGVMRGESDPGAIAACAERFDNHHLDSPAWRAALAGTV